MMFLLGKQAMFRTGTADVFALDDCDALSSLS
jgi:hypothetical protein